MNLRRFLPVPLLAFALVHPASSAPHLDGSAIVVVPSLARISGKPVQVGLLPLGRNAPYVLAFKTCRTGLELTAPEVGELSDAALSPDSRWIAYSSDKGVTVADLSGRIVYEEPDAKYSRWSQDGRALAMILAGQDRHQIAVWLPGSHTDFFDEAALAIAWQDRRTLLFSRDGKVWSLDTKSGDRARSPHLGVIVSPDGLYSVHFVGGWGSRPVVTHDGSGADVSGDTFTVLGPCAPSHYDPPFWVRGADHLLCISLCGDWSQPDGSTRWGCRTGVVDVLTSKLVASWPGNALGPSADQSSVWVTDGFDMSPCSLPRSRSSGELRIRVSTQQWGKGGTRDLGSKSYDLRPGDFIPGPGGWRLPPIYLTEVLGPGRGVFRIGGAYSVTTPFNHQPSPGFYEVSEKGLVYATNSWDAGWVMTISVLP